MHTFRDQVGLRPDTQDPEQVDSQAEELGLFKDSDQRLEIFRMLQQRLYERKQRSQQMQDESRDR